MLVKLVQADEHGAIPLVFSAAGPSGVDAKGTCMGRANSLARRRINNLAERSFRVGKYRQSDAAERTIKRC
jgi:hypothetical protein